MKKNNIIFITILVFCILLTGCFNKKQIVVDNPLVKVKKEMLKNIKNYSYDINVRRKNSKEDFTIKMQCENDLENRTNYCITYNDGYNKEKYIDFRNRIYYSRLIYLENSNVMPWEKSTRYTNTNINYFINVLDSTKDIEKVDEDHGTYYNGIIRQKALSLVIEEADTDINPDYIKDVYIPISVYVNEDGIIEKISSELSYNDTTDTVEIIFKKINETESVIIPKM